MLAGGYRKKDRRAISRLGSLARLRSADGEVA
jgi:hypothetical protein